MKKIVALLICVLLVAALAIPVFAADDTVVTITPNKATVAPGEEVTFTVTVSGENAYNAFGLLLKYDKTQFEIVEGKCTVGHAATSQFSAKRGFVLAFEEPEAFEGTVGWFTLKAIAECPVEAVVNATPSVKNGGTTIAASVGAGVVSITGEHGFGAWTPNGDNHVHTCSKCGAEETGEHSMVKGEVTQQPNCTTEGKQNATCSDCGLTTSVSIPTNDNHSWNAGEITTEPKCGVEGVKTYTCQHNAEHTKTEVIPALEHKYEAVVTAPTCEEKGYTTHTCSVCKDSYVDTYVNPTGHNYKPEVTKEATCKDEGVRTYTCQNDASHTYTESIPKTTTHTASNETVEIKAPTCTEKGISSGKCAVCGVNIDQFETDALGHDMGDWIIDADSTCAVEGKKHKECSRCDHTEDGTIEKKEHNYESVVTAPTCTKNGYTTHTCSGCGNSYDVPGDKALGHEFGEYKQTKAPTCTEKGEEVAKCVRCDVTDTKDIPAAGHKYEGTKVEPTCTKPGKESGKCSVCGDEVNEKEIPALGHDFGEYKQTKAPTCTEKGEETAQCSRCEATDVKEIPALGHTFGDWINVDEKNHKHVCACGHEETAAHKWDTGKVTVEPTHTTTGIKTFVCKDCHATREEVVDKITKHDYTSDAKQIVDEEGNVDKKYHTGICACGEEHKEKHSYDIEGKIIKEPTATERGEKEMFCACGHMVIAKIKADGTLDGEPGMGDITGQVVMTGVAAFSMLAAAAYVFTRKRTA